MERTKQPAPPMMTRRGVGYAYHCHFPCPCGGRVPNAPTSCGHAKIRSHGAGIDCIDILICQNICLQNETCPTILQYYSIFPERKRKNV